MYIVVKIFQPYSSQYNVFLYDKGSLKYLHKV